MTRKTTIKNHQMDTLSNNNAYHNGINFKAIQLSQKEATKSMQLLAKYNRADIQTKRKLTTDLLKIFNEKLQEENLRYSKKNDPKDTIQEMYLCFLESIIDSTEHENPLEYILNKINKFRPNKYSKKTMLGDMSIDNHIRNAKYHTEETYRDILVVENPTKQTNNKKVEQLHRNRKNIEEILTEKEKQIYNLYLEGNSIAKIIRTLGISKTRVENHFGVIFAKIQDFYKVFDKKNKDTMKVISNTYSREETVSIKKILIKIPSLKRKKPEIITDKINKLSEILNIDSKQCIDLVSKHPNLILLNPQTIQDRINKSSKTLNIDPEEFKKMGLKVGSMLYASPQKLNKRAEEIAEVLNTSKENVINIAKIFPNILSTKSSTLQQKIKKLAKILGISIEQCQNMYAKTTYLISRNITSLTKNMHTTAKLLKINYKEYLKLSVKKTNLIYQSPETIFNNVRETSEHFNIPMKKLINAYKVKPQLFIQKPKTIQQNAEDLSKLFKMPINECLNLCLSLPQLFYQNPKTIYNNAVNYAKLTNKPLKEVIQQAKKQPTLLATNPQNTATKKEIIEFFALVRNKEHSGGVRMNSTNDLYASILRHLIKKSGAKDFPSSRKIFETTKEYILNHPDKEYSFELPKHKQYDSFVDFSENLSKELLGRNIFSFKEK